MCKKLHTILYIKYNMHSLVNLGPSIKSVYGPLSKVGSNTSTEIIDLYQPLDKLKNQNLIWLGLNLIFPSYNDIQLPINDAKCFIATFHGDPLDLDWINLSRKRLIDSNIDPKNFIVCSNIPKLKINLFEDITYFQIEHLHLLSKWYGNKNLHLARPSIYRQFNFSFLSNREIWFRTALFALIYKFDKGILSFPCIPNLQDINLINFMQTNSDIKILDDLEKFLPLPVDNYYESIHDLQNAWTVNNIAYQNCLINLVNESTNDYFGHMSEKSFKPLISKTLPVYSSIKQINRLEEFGFKFNKIFYDTNHDPILRQVNTLKNLINLPKSELISLVEEFSEHNRNWFFDNFYDKVYNDNQKEINSLIEYVKNIVD